MNPKATAVILFAMLTGCQTGIPADRLVPVRLPLMARATQVEFSGESLTVPVASPREAFSGVILATVDSLTAAFGMLPECSRFAAVGGGAVVYLESSCHPTGIRFDGDFLIYVSAAGRYRYGRVPDMADSLGLATATFVSAGACQTRDSAVVARWHSVWDGVPVERLAEVAASRRREEAPTMRLGPVDVAFGTTPLVDHWKITAVLANRFGPDLRWTGRLRLSPTSAPRSKDPAGSGMVDHSSGWLFGDSLIKAWWSLAADSMPVRAMLHPDGTLWIGLDPPADDGGALQVRALDSYGMYGTWWPAGSVRPPYMGWFCAEPVVFATQSGWGP